MSALLHLDRCRKDVGPEQPTLPMKEAARDPQAGFLASVLDHLEEGVYFVDRERRITLWNRGAEEITGWPSDAVLGRRCSEGVLRHCDSSGAILCGSGCPLLAAMDAAEPRSAEAFMLRRDGARIPVRIRVKPMFGSAGEVTGCVEVFSNDSDRLSVLEEMEELRDQALLDPLTDLPNRRFLDSRLPGMFERSRPGGAPFGLLFIDLDHFKAVNDTFGHAMGDEVLRVSAATIRSNLRSVDLIARWGGEEFVVVVPHPDAAQFQKLSERLRVLIEQCEIGRPQHDIRVTASIGGTLAHPRERWEEVAARADELMYTSKRNGRNRVTHG